MYVRHFPVRHCCGKRPTAFTRLLRYYHIYYRSIGGGSRCKCARGLLALSVFFLNLLFQIRICIVLHVRYTYKKRTCEMLTNAASDGTTLTLLLQRNRD
jgi:hypothetical protein